MSIQQNHTALFHPRQQSWTVHFRWNGPLLIGLTPTGRATVALLNINHELFPKPVDGDDRLSGDSFSVDEHDAVDQFLQFLTPVQFPPA